MIKLPYGSMQCNADLVDDKITKLLNSHKYEKSFITEVTIKTRILAAYETIEFSGSERSLSKELNATNEALIELRHFMDVICDQRSSNNVRYLSKKVVFVDDLDRITKFIEDNAKLFSTQELVDFIEVLSREESFTRTGYYGETIDFINLVIDEKSPENAIYIFKTLSEIAFKNNVVTRKPTLSELKKAYKNGVLEQDLMIDLKILFITDLDKK